MASTKLQRFLTRGGEKINIIEADAATNSSRYRRLVRHSRSPHVHPVKLLSAPLQLPMMAQTRGLIL